MDIVATEIPAVKLITPRRFGDSRGHFAETYSRRALERAGFAGAFVQDNQSLSALPGTVRGLHFQTPPFAQDKLVRVIRGAVLDVAVDLRRGSPTYGRHVAIRLDAATGMQILIPAGFAHGFCTLEPDTELFYKVSDYYAPDHDAGLRWDDPDLGIPWPVDAATAILSDKDRRLPFLGDLPPVFV